MASLASQSHSKENRTPADQEKLISTNVLSIRPLKLKVHWNNLYYCLWHWSVYSIRMCFKNTSAATEDHCSPITQSWTCPRSPPRQAAGLSFDRNSAHWWHLNAWSELSSALCFQGRVRREGAEDGFYTPPVLIYGMHASLPRLRTMRSGLQRVVKSQGHQWMPLLEGSLRSGLLRKLRPPGCGIARASPRSLTLRDADVDFPLVSISRNACRWAAHLQTYRITLWMWSVCFPETSSS